MALDSLAALSNLRSILVIPFEDEDIVDTLRRLHPEAQIDILSKESLTGKLLMQSLSAFRRTRYDLVCSSLHGGIIRRSKSSVQGLLSLFHSRSYSIRINEFQHETRSLAGLLLHAYPRILVGVLLGMFVTLLSYGYLLTWHSKAKRIRPSNAAPPDQSLLFLRTDLAGAVQSGGSVTHIKGVIGAFLRRGFRVTYVADARCTALPPDVDQIIIAPVQGLDFFDELQLLAYNFNIVSRYRRIRNIAKPTLIYQRHSAFGFSLGYLSRLMGAPCVLEVNASEVWVKKHWSRLFLSQLASLAEARAVGEVTLVNIISKGASEQLEAQGLHATNALINPNGVDAEEFHPGIDGRRVRRHYGLPAKILVVGFIGTFAAWHGVDVLVEAAILSLKKRSMRFLLIGDGALRSALERGIIDRGLERSITFTGLISHSEAPEYLAACDILVSPHPGFKDDSKFFGSPTKLFEYMAMGKAIVASDLEQIGEVIRDGSNGLLVKPGDPRDLADKILRLANNPGLRRRLGKQARIAVERNYTWDHNVGRVLESLNVLKRF